MKKIIFIIFAVALASCSTEPKADVITTEPGNSDDTTQPADPVDPIVGSWELIKTETYYDWGVDTDVIICGRTLEIFSNLEAISANCIGGGVREFSLIQQGDRYICDYQEDTYVYIDGEYLKEEYAGDTPRIISIFRRY